jgi:hypothetical protein
MLLAELISFIKEQQDLERSKFSNEDLRGRILKTFPWDEEGMKQYLIWAFCRDYLLIDSDENGLTGITVAYVLPFGAGNCITSLLPYETDVPREQEHTKDITIMDTIFKTKAARKNITQKFMKRFPNWRNQRKFGNRKGLPVVLTNKYIELVGGLN